MPRRPHRSVQRAVKLYGRRVRAKGGMKRPLRMVFNPNWRMDYREEDGTPVSVRKRSQMWMVVQKVPWHKDVPGVTGLKYTERFDFPVHFMPRGDVVDRRLFRSMEESRLTHFRENLAKNMEEEDRKFMKKQMDFAEDFAKYYYSAFKKEYIDPYNFSNVPDVDKYRNRRKLVDHLGRPLRMGPG